MMKPMIHLTILTALGFGLWSVPARALELQNEVLKVRVDESNGVISLAPARTEFGAASRIHVSGVRGAGGPFPITDTDFGTGQLVELRGPQGRSGTLRIFPGLPFVLIRLILVNNDKEPRVLDKVPVADLEVKLGQPSTTLTTLGTGGLQSAEKKPGSYAWMAVAEPSSRHGLVAGWLTHERASGTLFASATTEGVRLEARGEYGTLRLLPGEKTTSETLALGFFADARFGLEAWADAVACVDHIRLHSRPSGYCTWYSEKHGRGGDESSLPELAAFAAQQLKPHGFSFVQIDDYWQLGNSKSGPNKNFTAHNPKGPYPSGMKAMADKIKALGLTPGLWFMPFAGNWDDPWFADHQDWFVKRHDGKPFSSKWSATCLDMSQPGAREYVRSVVARIAHEWGYTYFKMDGFHTGAGTSNVYVNSGYKEDDMSDAVFADPHKTNIEVFRDGIRLVRDAAGPDVFFLGCCVTQNMRSYEGSFGLLDAMRVGPDNTGSWKGWSGASPVFGTRHYFLNGRIWWNDPDPEYVRSSVTLEEARTMASWAALSGQLNTNSDWIPSLPPERLEILRRTLAPHQATARPVDFFENAVPRIWLVSQGAGVGRRDVAGFYNWDNDPREVEVSPERLGLAPAPAYAAFDFWANTFLPILKGNITVHLAPHACQVLALHPLDDHPFLLGTSRHVTQGMIDVTGEAWEAASKSLSGRSQVVAGDVYELRVFVPAPWKAVSVVMGGQKVDIKQEGFGLRASFLPQQSETVEWRLIFQ